MDDRVLAVECIAEHSYGDSKVNEGDTIFVYHVNAADVWGWYLYDKVYIPVRKIVPLDTEQYAFLKYRGLNNVVYRDSIAKSKAALYAQRYLARLEIKKKELEAKLLKIEKEVSAKQLFFRDYDYVHGDYGELGMKFEIHNCWKKTIKYVEFTTTAYNAVGDVQKDRVGKSVVNVRGIGPLESGESASWSFEDMYYDRNNIIDWVKLTKITFIFMDGTTKTFSGANNINKHRWTELNL